MRGTLRRIMWKVGVIMLTTFSWLCIILGLVLIKALTDATRDYLEYKRKSKKDFDYLEYKDIYEK